MRENPDVFVKEFMQHPAWEMVIDSIDKLSEDLIHRLVYAKPEELYAEQGRIQGVYEVLAHIRGLINKYK